MTTRLLVSGLIGLVLTGGAAYSQNCTPLERSEYEGALIHVCEAHIAAELAELHRERRLNGNQPLITESDADGLAMGMNALVGGDVGPLTDLLVTSRDLRIALRVIAIEQAYMPSTIETYCAHRFPLRDEVADPEAQTNRSDGAFQRPLITVDMGRILDIDFVLGCVE